MINRLAAQEVATTLAGDLIVYVIFPLCVIGIAAAFAAAFRFNKRQQAFDIALARALVTLATCVETLTGNGQAIVANSNDIDSLQGATALLKDRMDRHDAWVATESARLDRRLQQRGIPE